MGKQVRRLLNQRVVAFIEKMATEEARAIYKKRGEVAEFPNAWIKEKFGLRQFRLRGLIKVGMETLWACLTYNIKLWIRLVWRESVSRQYEDDSYGRRWIKEQAPGAEGLSFKPLTDAGATDGTVVNRVIKISNIGRV